jgi:hypothetical protein
MSSPAKQLEENQVRSVHFIYVCQMEVLRLISIAAWSN